MRCIGVDLSGPANAANTAAVCLDVGGGGMSYVSHDAGLDDVQILNFCLANGGVGPVTIALDAPLSYQLGGGFRPSDAALRAALIAAGLPPGPVMAPMAKFMVYLTLRGHGVARVIHAGLAGFPHDVIESHPRSSMALGGAAIADVANYKQVLDCRRRLRVWFRRTKKVDGLPASITESDHLIDAVAAAWSAARWVGGAPAWVFAAAAPLHPYPFVC